MTISIKTEVKIIYEKSERTEAAIKVNDLKKEGYIVRDYGILEGTDKKFYYLKKDNN